MDRRVLALLVIPVALVLVLQLGPRLAALVAASAMVGLGIGRRLGRARRAVVAAFAMGLALGVAAALGIAAALGPSLGATEAFTGAMAGYYGPFGIGFALGRLAQRGA